MTPGLDLSEAERSDSPPEAYRKVCKTTRPTRREAGDLGGLPPPIPPGWEFPAIGAEGELPRESPPVSSSGQEEKTGSGPVRLLLGRTGGDEAPPTQTVLIGKGASTRRGSSTGAQVHERRGVQLDKQRVCDAILQSVERCCTTRSIQLGEEPLLRMEHSGPTTFLPRHLII
jgi:hypothetical protein